LNSDLSTDFSVQL